MALKYASTKGPHFTLVKAPQQQPQKWCDSDLGSGVTQTTTAV